MRVYKQKRSPFWTADYTTPEGQRVQRTTRCRDREAALRIAREWERAAEHRAADSATGIERPSEVTIADLARLYDQAISADDHSRLTVETYAAHLRAYIIPYFGEDAAAAGVTRRHVEEFRRILLSGGLSSQRVLSRRSKAAPAMATVNRIMLTLRRLLDFGVRAGHLQQNAAANLRTLRERNEERHRALSHEEIEAWVAQLGRPEAKRDDHVAWLRFALATGLRDSEIQTLDWRDVDLARSWLRVRSSKAKSGKSREVPILAPARVVLEAMPHRIGLVFGRHSRRKALANAWKLTKLPGRSPTPHDLRHTSASHAAASSLTLVQLMAMFAWKSPQTAARYLHLYGTQLDEIRQKLERAMA